MPTETSQANAPPPTTIDLRRQVKFGNSEVDEACVVLVELSVLVYEPIATMRRALDGLQLDRWSTIEAESPRAWDGQAFRSNTGQAQDSSRGSVLGAAAWALPPTGSIAGLPLAEGLQRILANSRVGAETPSPGPPRVLALLQGDCVLIVFRGTSTAFDIRRDLCCWPAFAWPLRHAGFHATWQEVRPQVNQWLQEVTDRLGTPPVVYLGGHSLGGAVATLAAIDLAKSYPVARVVTLGAPRAGGWLLRQRYASSPAAPSAQSTTSAPSTASAQEAPKLQPRHLPDVTTRWVHGVDIFANFLPPPLVTVHVAKATALQAKERLDIESYFAVHPLDATPVVSFLTGLDNPPLAPGQRSKDLRRIAGQIGLGLSMWLPWSGWARLLVYVAPMVAEQAARSGFHHRSRLYLGFMPPTALARAMRDPSLTVKVQATDPPARR